MLPQCSPQCSVGWLLVETSGWTCFRKLDPCEMCDIVLLPQLQHVWFSMSIVGVPPLPVALAPLMGMGVVAIADTLR